MDAPRQDLGKLRRRAISAEQPFGARRPLRSILVDHRRRGAPRQDAGACPADGFQSYPTRRTLAHILEGNRSRQLQSFRSEEHTSELQSLMRISYAVFCLKKKK